MRKLGAGRVAVDRIAPRRHPETLPQVVEDHFDGFERPGRTGPRLAVAVLRIAVAVAARARKIPGAELRHHQQELALQREGVPAVEFRVHVALRPVHDEHDGAVRGEPGRAAEQDFLFESTGGLDLDADPGGLGVGRPGGQQRRQHQNQKEQIPVPAGPVFARRDPAAP